jgi:hypothetical protein
MVPTTLPDSFLDLPWYKRLSIVDIVKLRLVATSHVYAKLNEACAKNGDSVQHVLQLESPTDNELLHGFRENQRNIATGVVFVLSLSALCWLVLFSLYGQTPAFGLQALISYMQTIPPGPATMLVFAGNILPGLAVAMSVMGLLTFIPPLDGSGSRIEFARSVHSAASRIWYIGDKAIYVFSPRSDSVQTFYFDALGATSYSGPDLRRRVRIYDRVGNTVLQGTMSLRYGGHPVLDGGYPELEFIDEHIATPHREKKDVA